MSYTLFYKYTYRLLNAKIYSYFTGDEAESNHADILGERAIACVVAIF